jgi:Arabinose efflux permease
MADRREFVLISVLVGTLMSAIDTTIVILALPTITAYFHASLVTTIWVILIYLLLLAAFTTQLGRLGDIFGRGKMFNSGFLVFIAGSAASGASPTIDILIISRGIQAFGAALMQANSSAIVADNFEPSQRGRAFGITTMGWNIGGTPWNCAWRNNHNIHWLAVHILHQRAHWDGWIPSGSALCQGQQQGTVEDRHTWNGSPSFHPFTCIIRSNRYRRPWH